LYTSHCVVIQDEIAANTSGAMVSAIAPYSAGDPVPAC